MKIYSMYTDVHILMFIGCTVSISMWSKPIVGRESLKKLQ